MSYDAVVVGAGPSGLMAARIVAEKGFSVLVCEKEGDLGQKACAEGIPDFALKIAEIPASPSLISNTMDGVHIFPPDEKKVKVSEGFKGYIINKKLFLYALAQKAVDAGAELKMRSEVKDIKMTEGNVQKVSFECNGEPHEVDCNAVVGADGVGSIISRRCGFYEKNYQVSSCIQYKMVNCSIPDRNIIRMYLGNQVAPMGYTWIFPKNEYVANVGIGIRSKNAEQYLKRFLANHSQIFEKARVIRVEGALVPTGGQLGTIVRGNVVLCGDSAGQVLPLCSGGIWTGMSAGKDAGEAIAEALKSNDLSLLKTYPKRFGEYWGKSIAKSFEALKVIDKFSDDDLNDLAEVISGQDVLDLANGIHLKKIFLKIMRHPRIALKFTQKLL